MDVQFLCYFYFTLLISNIGCYLRVYLCWWSDWYLLLLEWTLPKQSIRHSKVLYGNYCWVFHLWHYFLHVYNRERFVNDLILCPPYSCNCVLYCEYVAQWQIWLNVPAPDHRWSIYFLREFESVTESAGASRHYSLYCEWYHYDCSFLCDEGSVLHLGFDQDRTWTNLWTGDWNLLGYISWRKLSVWEDFYQQLSGDDLTKLLLVYKDIQGYDESNC